MKNKVKEKDYKDFVKELDKLIKEAKSAYDHQEIEKNSSNSRRLWKIINAKLGRDKKTTSIKYLIDSNITKITDAQDISNKMNQYFCSIGKELANKIQ